MNSIPGISDGKHHYAVLDYDIDVHICAVRSATLTPARDSLAFDSVGSIRARVRGGIDGLDGFQKPPTRTAGSQRRPFSINSANMRKEARLLLTLADQESAAAQPSTRRGCRPLSGALPPPLLVADQPPNLCLRGARPSEN
jgi:hypothetical protein